MKQFQLNAEEKERADKFHKKCKNKAKGKDVHLSYHFYPTGIGTCVKVRSETLDIEKDITDLSNW